MHPSIPAALLMLLLAGGWLLGRRRARPFLRSTDTAAVAELNRSQIERLRERSAPAAREVLAVPSQTVPASAPGVAPAPPTALPRHPGQRRERLLQLQSWLVGSREQRLSAIAELSRSGGRDLLPLLRRGLRDPDPAVMAAAAAAIERYRGRPAPQAPDPAPPFRRRLPVAPAPGRLV